MDNNFKLSYIRHNSKIKFKLLASFFVPSKIIIEKHTFKSKTFFKEWKTSINNLAEK